MDKIELANFLAWCTIIDYSLLMIWFSVFTIGHDWLHLMHGKWFDLTKEQFDMFNYAGMGLFKLFIFIFNLAPYLALRIMA
ncbi:MAG: hypothetical protein ACI88A_002198 [Paraglaciecola sp.]